MFTRIQKAIKKVSFTSAILVWLIQSCSNGIYGQIKEHEQKLFGVVTNDSIGFSFEVPVGWFATFKNGDYYLHNPRAPESHITITPRVPGDLDDFDNDWHELKRGYDMKVEDQVEVIDSTIISAHVAISAILMDTLHTLLAIKNDKEGFPVGVYYIKGTTGSKKHMGGLVLDVVKSIRFYAPEIDAQSRTEFNKYVDKWILNDSAGHVYHYLKLKRNGTYLINSIRIKELEENEIEYIDHIQTSSDHLWTLRIIGKKKYLFLNMPGIWPMRMLVEEKKGALYLNGQQVAFEK